MDVESNTDSDTSESWSVFDLSDTGNGNDAEDSCDSNHSVSIVTQSQVNTEITGRDENVPEGLENGDCCLEEGEIEESAQNSLKSLRGETSNVTSPGEHSKDHQDFQVLYKGKGFQDGCDCEMKSSDCICSKTSFSDAGKIEVDSNFKGTDNDSDSISVISEDECNEYGCSGYENVEIWEGNVSEDNVQGKTYPNVLKRKRKRLKLNYKESSDENANGDFTFPIGTFPANSPNTNVEKSTKEVEVIEYPSTPVYRHYRNNMANTILSLAMGIIFAGVACIALGHFLGVHDAQQTVGEMMETLKRLQMENVILQSRMRQLSRGVHDGQHATGEMLETLKRLQMKNMMLQSRMSHATNLVCQLSKEVMNKGNKKENRKERDDLQDCEGKCLGVETVVGKEKVEDQLLDVDNRGNPVVLPITAIDQTTKRSEKPDEDSSEWKCNNNPQEVGDQSAFVNVSKIADDLPTILYSVTSPAKGPPEMYHGDMLTTEEKPEDESGNPVEEGKTTERRDDSKVEEEQTEDNCLAIREKDLSKFRWFIIQGEGRRKRRKTRRDRTESEIESSSPREEGSECTNLTYMFPQPKEYYKRGEESVERDRWNAFLGKELQSLRTRAFHSSNVTEHASENTAEEVKKKEEEESGGRERNAQAPKLVHSSKKKEKVLVKKVKSQRKSSKQTEERSSKTGKKSTKKEGKGKDGKRKEERMCHPKFLQKRSSKTGSSAEGGDAGRKERKEDRTEKTGKVRRKERRAAAKQSQWDRGCYLRNLWEWLSKRAKGRERFRHYEKMSSWQFERAKSRNELRKVDDNWQFERAKCRDELRKVDDNWQMKRARGRDKMRERDVNWQLKRAAVRENIRNNMYRHFKKKNSKYSQQRGFFSHAFSWI